MSEKKHYLTAGDLLEILKNLDPETPILRCEEDTDNELLYDAIEVFEPKEQDIIFEDWNCDLVQTKKFVIVY